MSREGVGRLVLACLCALAALSFNCPEAFAQDSASVAGSMPATSVLRRDLGIDAHPPLDLFGDADEQAQGGQQNGQARTPLTPGEKMRRSFKRAFLSPFGYGQTALSAILTEASEEDLPHKERDDRVADGASRFAIKFSTRATRVLLGSGVFPSLFKQDPRYERSSSTNFGRRTLHAVSRVFVTRGDDGTLQPNYSRFAGNLSASALANLWEQSTPGRDRIGADATFKRFGSLFITDAIGLVVLNEFMPDIIRIFKR
jgi:hypothetical protein